MKVVKDMHGFTHEEKILDVRYSELVPASRQAIHDAEMNLISVPETTLSSDYIKMFNNQFLSDVTFKVGSSVIYAHKIILASRCEYFNNLYSSGLKDASDNEIVISNYSYSSVYEFLRFLYTGSCDIKSVDRAMELITIADYYKYIFEV